MKVECHMNSIEPVRILAVGDIMLGEHPGSLGLGVLSKWKQTGTDPLSLIERILSKHHVVIGNLECVLSDSTDRSGYQKLILRALPVFARYLATKGIHVLSVANNHTMDHGYDAFEETVSSLQNVGILVCGTKNDPARMEMDVSSFGQKRKISFFGASFRPNDTSLEPQYVHIAHQKNFENLKSQLYQESKHSDLTVVQCHWGDEFITIPSVEQIQLANELVQAGADVIVGHHSHVYQGLWTINQSPVFFSLGNFISDMREAYLRRSAIGSILWKDSELTSTSIPIRLNDYHQPYLSEADIDRAFIKSADGQRAITNSKDYAAYYSQVLRRAKLRYKIDTFLNLLKTLGTMPNYRLRMILGILSRYIGQS
ncbi:MAG: CapA family protein [Candidatus Thorarchaeota archaeon]|jgi:poly-gamma-glutamate synthesis protein (capsule biosynthesis protein)